MPTDIKRYVISYYLHTDDSFNYMPFYDAIKNLSSRYMHIMEHSWLIESEMSAKEIYTTIRKLMYKTDQIFIVDITDTTNYSGFLITNTWKWLKNE